MDPARQNGHSVSGLSCACPAQFRAMTRFACFRTPTAMPVHKRKGGERGRAKSDEESVIVPELTEKQREEVQERAAITALVVHEAVRRDGDQELQRPISALA